SVRAAMAGGYEIHSGGKKDPREGVHLGRPPRELYWWLRARVHQLRIPACRRGAAPWNPPGSEAASPELPSASRRFHPTAACRAERLRNTLRGVRTLQ